MASADSVTLACGCVIVASAEGASLTPVCAAHTADIQALALAASQDPVVIALVGAAAGNAAPGGFSYSGNPAASALDRVRFTLQDTNAKSPLFSDAEIAGVLSESGDDWLTTSLVLLDSLTARFAGACDESVGSVSIAYSQRAAGYQRLSDTLRARLVKRGVPYAGGISRSDKIASRIDADRVQPAFTTTMFHSHVYPDTTTYLGGGDWYVRWSGPQLYGANT